MLEDSAQVVDVRFEGVVGKQGLRGVGCGLVALWGCEWAGETLSLSGLRGGLVQPDHHRLAILQNKEVFILRDHNILQSHTIQHHALSMILEHAANQLPTQIDQPFTRSLLLLNILLERAPTNHKITIIHSNIMPIIDEYAFFLRRIGEYSSVEVGC